MTCILWLRRDLRLDDHAALHHALKTGQKVQPVFVFDSEILTHFPSKDDRRLPFLADTLCALHKELQKRGGGLLVLHGKATQVIPKLAHDIGATHLVAAEDYEPEARRRDEAVAKALHTTKALFVQDQVVFGPEDVLLKTGGAYKVFTPYANAWRAKMTPATLAAYVCEDHQRYADYKTVAAHSLPVDSPQAMLKTIGYHYRHDALWQPDQAHALLKNFIAYKSEKYEVNRNFMAIDGTSRLSPYLRFGLISIRECALAAVNKGASVWLSELIWRDFYAMNLYHHPDSAKTEWNPKYREKLHWSHNDTHFKAWQEGKTGYPVVDAAMRQLLSDGWMHNRARMIVASFLTKHLRIDWRKGEAHFGQYLMDYDLASNIGGWQWAASTGTDAQPYFRVFNPLLQSKRFDPDGDYIRAYVPELKEVSKKIIHAPWLHAEVRYYEPLVDHDTARKAAIAMFKIIR